MIRLLALLYAFSHPVPQGQHYCYHVETGQVIMERLNGPGRVRRCGLQDLPPCVMVHHDGEHEPATPDPKESAEWALCFVEWTNLCERDDEWLASHCECDICGRDALLDDGKVIKGTWKPWTFICPTCVKGKS
jgi:hypothetical protein